MNTIAVTHAVWMIDPQRSWCVSALKRLEARLSHVVLALTATSSPGWMQQSRIARDASIKGQYRMHALCYPTGHGSEGLQRMTLVQILKMLQESLATFS